jgi:hypothetical protein
VIRTFDTHGWGLVAFVERRATGEVRADHFGVDNLDWQQRTMRLLRLAAEIERQTTSLLPQSLGTCTRKTNRLLLG